VVVDAPLCSCHGQPQYWQKDKRKKEGGLWMCVVRRREHDWNRRRRKGMPVRGSAEYLAKRMVAEPAYRTMHHRARKALQGKSCAFCGSNDRIEAALKHDGSPVARRVANGRVFSIHTEDYMPLCRLCHTYYDGVSERVRKQHAEGRT